MDKRGMMQPETVSEGYIPFKKYQTYYRVVGDSGWRVKGKIPILAIHGRPVSHEALEPLIKIAESDRPVIFYDQLGCGRSERPDDPSMWTIGHFVEEVDAIRNYLNLERVHLLGHSWGGVVAMEYALGSPDGLSSLILASTYCDRALLNADYDRLRDELPAEVRDTLHQHEAAGTTDDPAYIEADNYFAKRHVCRVESWPEYLIRSEDHPPAGEVNMEGWSVRGRLNEIHTPTLITCGRYDFCTPAKAEIIHEGIHGSEFVVFEASSHYAHIEESDRYLAVLNEFLTRAEREVIKTG
jgi:proline-specific peptidase